jgi:cytochrome b involved in lipid metabolism
MTDFAEEHPAGATFYDLGGKDGTAAFASVHNMVMLEEFDDV